MYYALVHYLEKYPKEIDVFRFKYDPRVDIAAPHLTFIFPVDASLGENKLDDHISQVFEKTKAFTVEFTGITQSWDDLVFLGVKAGSEQVIELHDKLYSGLMAPFLRKDLEYLPHITLGKATPESLSEAYQLNIHFQTTLKNCTLIKRENEMSQVLWSKEFKLR